MPCAVPWREIRPDPLPRQRPATLPPIPAAVYGPQWRVLQWGSGRGRAEFSLQSAALAAPSAGWHFAWLQVCVRPVPREARPTAGILSPPLFVSLLPFPSIHAFRSIHAFPASVALDCRLRASPCSCPCRCSPLLPVSRFLFVSASRFLFLSVSRFLFLPVSRVLFPCANLVLSVVLFRCYSTVALLRYLSEFR